MDGFWSGFGHGGVGTLFLLTVVFAAAIALTALWVTLPLAVLGVRSALRELAAEQRETNRELAELRALLARPRAPAEPLTPAPGDGP